MRLAAAARLVWPRALGADEPCVLCGGLTPLRSDAGKPCHKICVEEWFEKRPEAWARFLSGDAA